MNFMIFTDLREHPRWHSIEQLIRQPLPVNYIQLDTREEPNLADHQPYAFYGLATASTGSPPSSAC